MALKAWGAYTSSLIPRLLSFIDKVRVYYAPQGDEDAF